MATIFEITGEGAGESPWEFDSIQNEGSCVFALDNAVKHGGSNSYSVTYDGTNDEAYGVKAFAEQGELFIRTYIYIPSDFDFAGQTQYNRVLYLKDGGTDIVYWGFKSGAGTSDPDRWVLSYRFNNQESTQNFSLGEWHYVELRYYPDGSAGGATLSVDGDVVLSDLDQAASYAPDTVWVGSAFAQGPPGNGEVFYVDDIKAADAGPIGPSGPSEIEAESCSQAHVEAAIASANNGDTVRIPAGECTWASAITLAKEIAIIGAGVGSTVITNYGFSVTDGTDNWRISGIEWTTSLSITFIAMSSLYSETGHQDFRIDHCSFKGANIGIAAWGKSKGVIDNNEFDSCLYAVDVTGGNTTRWGQDTGLGGVDFVFIENNHFKATQRSITHCVTGNYTAKYVIRHNIFEESASYRLGDVIDMHGCGHSTNGRGGRAFEIYDNQFIKKRTEFSRAIRIRGGTGVIFGNVFDESSGHKWNGAAGDYFNFTEYRVAKFMGMQATSCNATEWCPLGDGGEGYPCCDQIGRGKNQALEPTYVWGNEDHLGNPITTITIHDNGEPVGDYIQKDRDYYKSAMPGYSAYAYPHPSRGEGAPGRSQRRVAAILVSLVSGRT